MRFLSLGCFVIVVALWAPPVEAQSLEAAQQMLARQEYEGAQRALHDVLRGGGLDRDQLVAVYRGLAECGAALRHPVEARDAFISLLVVDPDFYIASHESPLIREPFESAQEFWRERRMPSVRLNPPEHAEDGEPLLLEAQVQGGDRPLMLSEVTFHLRLPNGRYEAMPSTDGRVEIEADRLNGAEELELYLTVRDQWGNLVTSIGEASQPLRIALDEAERGERPWYRRWWVWTIVGVAVVGLAVGLPAGIVASGSGGSCEEALGGDCDFHLQPDL